MAEVEFCDDFKKKFSKIKDARIEEKIIKQVMKLKERPEFGKPMRYERKGTRELYIPPFRLSYAYLENKNIIVILDLYHKD